MKVAMDRLYKRVIGLQKAGAPSLVNHAGSVSRPVAVSRRRSSTRNTCHSLKYSSSASLAESLRRGAV